MLPDYSKFQDDLAALKAKIDAVHAQFVSSISGNMDGHPFKKQYDALKAMFTSLDADYNILTDGNATADQKNAAWDRFTAGIEEADMRMPNPSLDEADTDKLNANLGDDDFRRLYRATHRISELAIETYIMTARGSYADIERDIELFDTQGADYISELNKYDSKPEYNGYYDMVQKERSYREESLRHLNAYNEMVSSDILGRFSNEYDRIHKETSAKLMELWKDQGTIRQSIREVEAAVGQLDEEIGNLKLDETDIRARQRTRTEELNDLYRRLNVNESSALEIAQQLTECNVSEENYQQEIRECRSLVEEKASAVPKGKKTDPAYVLTEKESEYASLLLKEERMNAFKNEFEDYLRESGTKDLSTEQQQAMLKEGKAMLKINANILKQYMENGSAVGRSVRFYNRFEEFKTEFIERYGITDEAKIEEIRQNVNTPYDLLRLWRKSYNNINNALSECLNVRDGDPTLRGVGAQTVLESLTKIHDSYTNADFRRLNCIQLEEQINALSGKKDSLETERASLLSEISSAEKRIKEESFENKMGLLTRRRDNLTAQQERLDVEIDKYNKSIAEQKNIDYQALQAVDRTKRELNEHMALREKNDKLREKTAAEIARFESLYEKKSAMKDTYDRIVDKTSLHTGRRGVDFLTKLKQDVGIQINHFRNSMECAKKDGHENSDKFNDVCTALTAFTKENNKLFPTIALSDAKYFMERIRDAAQSYIAAKEDQFRPFPSTQRKYRLDWARRLAEYADTASKRIGEADTALKDIDGRILRSGISDKPFKVNREDIFVDVKRAVATKEKKAADIQKQNELKPEKTEVKAPENPVVHP